MPLFFENTPFPLLYLGNKSDWGELPKLCNSFLTSRDCERISVYLNNTAKAVLVEKEYIDKDYRDTYSNFFTKKFADYPSKTARLHFFSTPIPPSEIWDLSKF